jgi:hypothetical protein
MVAAGPPGGLEILGLKTPPDQPHAFELGIAGTRPLSGSRERAAILRVRERDAGGREEERGDYGGLPAVHDVPLEIRPHGYELILNPARQIVRPASTTGIVP